MNSRVIAGLCKPVTGVPDDTPSREWTLRADNYGHHHGRVRLTESPLYLKLCWRLNRSDPPKMVGHFLLDLYGLISEGCVRADPLGSDGSWIRLRIVRTACGEFYVQAAKGSPKALMQKL